MGRTKEKLTEFGEFVRDALSVNPEEIEASPLTPDTEDELSGGETSEAYAHSDNEQPLRVSDSDPA